MDVSSPILINYSIYEVHHKIVFHHISSNSVEKCELGKVYALIGTLTYTDIWTGALVFAGPRVYLNYEYIGGNAFRSVDKINYIEVG